MLSVIFQRLRFNAMREPEKYRDLMVRAAGHVACFVELGPNQQMGIINRTEQQEVFLKPPAFVGNSACFTTSMRARKGCL
jgi:hypothetical protein